MKRTLTMNHANEAVWLQFIADLVGTSFPDDIISSFERTLESDGEFYCDKIPHAQLLVEG